MKLQMKTRRFLTVALFALSLLMLFPNSANAKGKVKLSATKKTAYVGKTYTVKLLNNKKKVKWTASNKNIKIVSKNNTRAKIKGVKKGTSYLKAKVGKKTYKCKITVKKKPTKNPTKKPAKEPSSGVNESPAEKIEYELQDTGRGVVAMLKNKNGYHVSMTVKLVYYRDGKMIGTATDTNYAFQSGRTCALFFHAPYDSNYMDQKYDDYKISILAERGTNLICAAYNIKVESDAGNGKISASFRNDSGKKLEYVEVACIFYDGSGRPIGYEKRFAECGQIGSVDYITFDYPRDENYETIYPKIYRLFVNSAYTYDWMN